MAYEGVSSTCPCNYHRLQVTESKYLRVIGNHPRRTPNSHLHNSLNIKPITVLIHRLTDKCFAHCPSHPNPPVQQTGNYTLAELTNLYKKYKHKRTKHILLNYLTGSRCVVFVHNFSLPLFAPICIYIFFSSTCTIVSIFSQIGYRNNFIIYPCTHCVYCLCNKYIFCSKKKYVSCT